MVFVLTNKYYKRLELGALLLNNINKVLVKLIETKIKKKKNHPLFYLQ